MTEGKPKRSYWRRGPRKKKGAEDAAGTAAATPPVTDGEEPAPGSEASGAPETGESFAPPPAPDSAEAAGGMEAPAEESRPFGVVGWGGQSFPAEATSEPAESAPGEMDAGNVPTGEVPAKGRRRSRRRGKKKPGDALAQELSEESGETRAPAPEEEEDWGQ